MNEGSPTKSTRGYGWRSFVPLIVASLLGAWFFYSLSWAAGVSPGHDAINEGTATIDSCHRDPASLWLIYACDAEIELDEPAEPEQVVSSADALSGNVAVELVRAGRDWSAVVPAERPQWWVGEGGFAFLAFVGWAACTGLGFYAGRRLEQRAAGADPGLADLRGVRRLPAGRRRGRRKRRT